MPSRLGRTGLKPGARAPDFTLPSAAGPDVALHDFAERKVLLVFSQTGCCPCHAIVPGLDRVQADRDIQVLVVNNGTVEETRNWFDEVNPRVPFLGQQGFSVSRRYEVFATPFAFLIDERGTIASKGIVSNGQHIGLPPVGCPRRCERPARGTGAGRNPNRYVGRRMMMRIREIGSVAEAAAASLSRRQFCARFGRRALALGGLLAGARIVSAQDNVYCCSYRCTTPSGNSVPNMSAQGVNQPLESACPSEFQAGNGTNCTRDSYETHHDCRDCR